MIRRLPAALCCICMGIGFLGSLGSLLPLMSVAEQNLGLDLLYRLRGAEKPPADVVVVAIDRESAKAMNLPAAPAKWPRVLHARLLEQITNQGAAVVAFDLIFHEPQPSTNDQTLAAAMHRAGNVILTQPIDRQAMPIAGRDREAVTQVHIARMVSAIPMLADAALAQAPFPLPKVPIKLNQYWNFSPGSGDVPTLPVVALHTFARAAFDDFLALLTRVEPLAGSLLQDSAAGEIDARRMIATIRPLYLLFQKDPTLADRMLAELQNHPQSGMNPPRTDKLVRVFIGLYGAGSSSYLNLYGPPGSITTISYHRLLHLGASDATGQEKTLPPLKGKAVFVGQTESDWFKANDGFYTSFTQESGMDIAGVEIAATAFANLLEEKAVHPLSPMALMLLLFGWGVAGTLISLHFSTAVSASGLVMVNCLYFGLAYVRFKAGGIWYPLVMPVLVQTPAAFIAGLIWKYRKANTERRNIRKAFGYFLPDDVVGRLAANVKDLRAGGQVLYSICLITDAESYTPLSEDMDPQSLTRFMNSYYEAIFKPIKANQGLVLQVVGDSVLAIWAAPQPQSALKAAACKAAMEITEAVRQFNARPGEHELPTRIGMHAGEILLGNIGAMDHFEYRPVGDIVNTASRLEGLNKYLGTSMLASEEAFNPGKDYLTRSVGRFVFKGKSHPVRVHEILPGHGPSREQQVAVCGVFASGLQAFEHQQWDDAEKYLDQALQKDENDGPSQFYRKLCREYRQAPPGNDWDGTVYLHKK